MNIAQILKNKYPDRKWALNGDTYEGLVMLDGLPKPTLEELEAVWREVEAIIIAERKRQAYKLEADPLYAEWQALLSAGHEDAESRRLEWVAKREEIKSRFE